MYELVDGNIPVFGKPHDEGALQQIRNCFKDSRVAHLALMGDHHKGYGVPIGGVIAYKEAISPSGVGYDIGCGNKAVLTDADYSSTVKNIQRIMNEIFSQVSFGLGRINNEKMEHALFEDELWNEKPYQQLKDKAVNQLGTVGSGNHYVDIFADEQNRIWIGVHFGSRGLGHKTATHFLDMAGAKDDMDALPVVFSTYSNIGQDYIRGMQLAGKYAYAGRDWVCKKVAKILHANILEEIHNHHNFAWEEEHYGEKLWVVRKGATPNYPGQMSFVGGSMGDFSYIFRGKESPVSAKALYSTIHGAGRVMGRLEAKGKYKYVKNSNGIKECIEVRAAKVTGQMMNAWIREKNVCLVGGGVDESPHCYKRIEDVRQHHAETIEVVHTLRPLGAAMAPAELYDPYKD